MKKSLTGTLLAPKLLRLHKSLTEGGGMEKRHYGTYLPADLVEAVRAYSEETGIPQARIVEDALRDYLTERTDKDFSR